MLIVLEEGLENRAYICGQEGFQIGDSQEARSGEE